MMFETEIWAPVIGYDGDYEVSNFGNVKSNKNRKSKLLSQNTDEDGYKIVALMKNGVREDYKVHRLVAIHFVVNPCPNELTHVDHINDDPGCNYYWNLQWCTILFNNRKKFKNREKKELFIHLTGVFPSEVDELLKPYNFTTGVLYTHQILEIYNSDISIIYKYNISEQMYYDIKNGVIYKPITKHITHEIIEPKGKFSRKLSDQDVVDIYIALKVNGVPVRELMEKYNVGSSCIYGIKNGVYYSDITSKLNI